MIDELVFLSAYFSWELMHALLRACALAGQSKQYIRRAALKAALWVLSNKGQDLYWLLACS